MLRQPAALAHGGAPQGRVSRLLRRRAAPPAPAPAVLPGTVSMLLRELARAPAVPLETGWEPRLAPGAVVGRFELVRELGRGGFGVVYEALDRELGRRVAFKALKPGTLASGHDAAWLRDEAAAIARLHHPNLVTLYDAGQADSGPYLVLELIDGESLEDRIARGPLAPAEALRIVRAVAEGLGHAHAAGVVHRDLKPGNVLLGAGGAVKVLDFGLAHVLGRGGVEGGSGSFMAPEQRRGAPADPRVDTYALGVLLHLLLTGTLPPAGAARVPPAFRATLASLLADDPLARPASGTDAVAALDRVARTLAPADRRRRRVLAATAALGLVGGLVAAVVAQRWAHPVRTVTVAVADLQNTTGDPDLDALSPLVTASLEQSPRLKVVTRSRARDLLAQAGRGATGLDDAAARDAALRADAGALLTGRVRRDAHGFRLELRGVEPRSGRELFTANAQAHRKEDVLRAVDLVSADARRGLRESAAEVGATDRRMAQATTVSLEAWRHYATGKECMDRPSVTGTWVVPAPSTCAAEFRQAVALDPSFALAHYELARIDTALGEDPSPNVARALAAMERLSEPDGYLVRAFDARVRGKVGEALALYAAAIDARPEDKEAVGLAGELLHHAGRIVEAIPFFERALELDPAMEWPLDHLPMELGVVGDRERLRALVHRWERAQPTPGVLHALAQSFSWLGEDDRAIAVARQAIDVAGAGAVEELVDLLIAAERFDEAEEQLARVAPADAPRPAWATFDLARLQRLRGRRREAIATLAAAEAQRTLPVGVAAAKLLQLQLGDADPGPVAESCSTPPPAGPDDVLCAPYLAYAGALEGAAARALSLDPGDPAARMHAAYALLRRREPERALAELRAIEATWPVPLPLSLPAPSFSVGEVAFGLGRYEEALSVLRRFQALRLDALWRGWAYPRSLVLSARAAERLGRGAEALADVRHASKLLSGADPEDPDLAAARELESRLTLAQ